jgi:hypothetical protein
VIQGIGKDVGNESLRIAGGAGMRVVCHRATIPQ